MDIQAILSTTTPTLEFTAPSEEYGRQGTFSISLSGMSGMTVAMSRLLPAAADANGGAALSEAWVTTGDEFSRDAEYGMRSMSSGRLRLTLTGAGPVRVRVWR